MAHTNSVFSEKYGVTAADVELYLSEALSRGGDYADIFFEQRVNSSVAYEEQIIKTATKSVNLGVGVRVISGEKTGYAYAEDLDRESILKASRTAAFIADRSSQGARVSVTPMQPASHHL